MKARALLMLSVLMVASPAGIKAAGFTEPPITFYGKVTQAADGFFLPITSGQLAWTIQPTAGGAPFVVVTSLGALSGGYSYRLQIPVEKAPNGFTLTGATIPTSGTVASYNRASVTLDGLPLTTTSTFTFAENQRGKTERIDLQLAKAFPDQDGDRMPDWWEKLYGFDPSDPGDALLDADGDGITNLNEYLAGTNPRDPTTPTPTLPSQLLNLSARNKVATGDNVLIVGFILVGTENKKVIIRGVGPSLPIPGRLADPQLELHAADGSLLAFDDNWRDQQEAEIVASGIPPTNEREPAIVATLEGKALAQGGSAYSGILAGAGGTTGISLLEIYDLNTAANSKLANISTRAFVGTGDDLLIGGFIPGPRDRKPTRLLIRALGPSLTAFGVSGALQDPQLELHDANGTLLTNDNWKDATNASEIMASLPPSDDREAAMIITLPPGSGYSALVRGANDTTGVALLEIYAIE